jgi:hypothetical protein
MITTSSSTEKDYIVLVQDGNQVILPQKKSSTTRYLKAVAGALVLGLIVGIVVD